MSAPAEAVLGAVYAGAGRRFDGIIGYDLFDAHQVEIDYAGRVLRLYPPRRAPVAGEPVPIRIVSRKPYLDAALSIAGQDVQPICISTPASAERSA